MQQLCRFLVGVHTEPFVCAWGFVMGVADRSALGFLRDIFEALVLQSIHRRRQGLFFDASHDPKSAQLAPCCGRLGTILRRCSRQC